MTTQTSSGKASRRASTKEMLAGRTQIAEKLASQLDKREASKDAVATAEQAAAVEAVTVPGGPGRRLDRVRAHRRGTQAAGAAPQTRHGRRVRQDRELTTVSAEDGEGRMPIPATCSRCDAKTWIIFDAKPWCREHFLTETTAREDLAGGEPVSQRG